MKYTQLKAEKRTVNTTNDAKSILVVIDNVLKNSTYAMLGLELDLLDEEPIPEVCDVFCSISISHWTLFNSLDSFGKFSFNWHCDVWELLLIIPHSTTGFMISTTTNSSTVPNTKNSDIKRYQPSELSLDPVGLSDYIKKCHDNTDAILTFFSNLWFIYS